VEAPVTRANGRVLVAMLFSFDKCVAETQKKRRQ
jgi:hypothetical protein